MELSPRNDRTAGPCRITGTRGYTKKNKTPDSLWANLTPTAQLAQSIEKVGMPQVGQGLSIPRSTHLCLCLTEFLGPLKALSSDF